MQTDTKIPIAQRLKAVSDETRIGILAHLQSGECCVCEITGALDIRQSLLCFHLRILKEAGLISDRREGRWSYYALNREALQDLGKAVAALALPSRGRSLRRSCS